MSTTFPDRSITITGGGPGWSYWQKSGPIQDTPSFSRDVNGQPWVVGITYEFFAIHAELAPNPRLIRVYFSEDGIQSVIPEETQVPAGTDDLDDVSLRTDLTTEAIAPDGVMMSVLTSVGYILRRMTPASFRLWLGFIFPNAQELPVLREMLEIPDQSAPEYVAPDDTELADLRDRLNIPDPTSPVYVAPVGDELDDLLLELGIQRRGGLPAIPLNADHVAWLGWQLWPYIGFGPLAARPPNYEQLVDDETAAGIAKQIGGVWGVDIPLTGDLPRIVLEYAEVLVLAEQLYRQYGYEPVKPLTILEQLREMSDEDQSEFFLIAARALLGFQAKQDEAKAILCCGDDTNEEEDDDIVITILGHYEPITTPPPSPVIESVRKKIVNDTWVTYIQTNPVSTAASTMPAIYYRIATQNGGIYDTGFLPVSWDVNYNAAGLNEPSSNGDSNFDTNIYSAGEHSAGYFGLIYANTRDYEADGDNQHNVTLEMSMNADGSNAITISFVVTEGMNETVSTIYSR